MRMAVERIAAGVLPSPSFKITEMFAFSGNAGPPQGDVGAFIETTLFDPPPVNAPAPIVGAGLPGLILAGGGGLLGWWRRRRKIAVASDCAPATQHCSRCWRELARPRISNQSHITSNRAHSCKPDMAKTRTAWLGM
jgi:hypothetical protein